MMNFNANNNNTTYAWSGLGEKAILQEFVHIIKINVLVCNHMETKVKR